MNKKLNYRYKLAARDLIFLLVKRGVAYAQLPSASQDFLVASTVSYRDATHGISTRRYDQNPEPALSGIVLR